MRSLSFIPILLIACLTGSGQSCTSIHQGNFKISESDNGITIIARNEKYQIEENLALGVKMMFSITWINDCTYELRPLKIIKGNPAYFIKDAVITTEITKVKKHGYQAVTTSNLDERKQTFIVEIIDQASQ